MDENVKNNQVNDEQLEKVSGGCDISEDDEIYYEDDAMQSEYDPNEPDLRKADELERS
ncbi:MAG: hypothetical protein ACI4K7_11065 [Oscillospiraceae bacterium]